MRHRAKPGREGAQIRSKRFVAGVKTGKGENPTRLRRLISLPQHEVIAKQTVSNSIFAVSGEGGPESEGSIGGRNPVISRQPAGQPPY